MGTGADADNSSAADRLCDEGYAHLEAGRFNEARSNLLGALAIAPANPLAHYRLGLLCNDTGRPDEALRYFDATLNLQANNARAHNNRGSALQQWSRLPEAEAAFHKALELDPKLAPPYVNLGHLLEQRGMREEAIGIYDRAIAQGLDRGVFLQYRAAASGQSPPASPESWVRETFDNFASNFDAHLAKLKYAVPQELALRLSACTTDRLDILDLGCGTGQCGLVLAAHKRSLIGVDLSKKMLLQAGNHGVYDQLQLAEIRAFLRSAPENHFDAVIAADVFIYIGALDDVFRDTERVLRPGGWFLFSTEEQNEQDYVLRESGRYAQSQAYVSGLAAMRFRVLSADAIIVRMERETPLRGRLFVLQKPLAGEAMPERI